MKDYVLDANAIIRIFWCRRRPRRREGAWLFERAERNQTRLSMSVINVGEVLYILLKTLGEQRAFQSIQALQHTVTMNQGRLELND